MDIKGPLAVQTYAAAAAMGEAFYHQLVNVGISTTTGHIQVFSKGWDFDIIMPMSGNIPKISNSASIETLIKGNKISENLVNYGDADSAGAFLELTDQDFF